LSDLHFPDLHFEDYTVGLVFRAPGVTVTEAEIIDFAFRYDPQPIHTDKVAAEKSIYGGLISSGMLTMGLGLRMLLQAGFMGRASAGSPGLDEIRFHKPARPGDTLYASAEVTDARPSSKPERGVLRVAFRVENQRGELVTNWAATQIVMRREETK